MEPFSCLFFQEGIILLRPLLEPAAKPVNAGVPASQGLARGMHAAPALGAVAVKQHGRCFPRSESGERLAVGLDIRQADGTLDIALQPVLADAGVNDDEARGVLDT